MLNIDRSVAGRCIRKREFLNIADVRKDSDWEENHESKSGYRSMICAPVSDWAVLTVDGRQPMGPEIELITQLYCTIMESILIEQNRTIIQMQSQSFAEAGASGENVD